MSSVALVGLLFLSRSSTLRSLLAFCFAFLLSIAKGLLEGAAAAECVVAVVSLENDDDDRSRLVLVTAAALLELTVDMNLRCCAATAMLVAAVEDRSDCCGS